MHPVYPLFFSLSFSNFAFTICTNISSSQANSRYIAWKLIKLEAYECGSSHCGQSQSLWPHHIHSRDSPLASCLVPYWIQGLTDDVQSSSSACAKLHRRPAPVLPTLQNIAILIRLSSDCTQCTSPPLWWSCLLHRCSSPVEQSSPWDAKMWLSIHL